MKRIEMEETGINVYRCELWMDDYLWFASSDISGTSTTAEVIHNYALAYALNRYDRAFVAQEAPTYADDLNEMGIYPTPAIAENPRWTSLTFNAINTATQTTESPDLGKRLTPKMGRARVINPATSKRQAFSFFAFLRDDAKLPRIIRLGKKRSPGHMIRTRLENPVATYSEEEVAVNGIINPLDVKKSPRRYSMISIPPHMLLNEVTIGDVWLLQFKYERILIPHRVLKWMGIET